MSRISTVFSQLQIAGKKALVPYVSCGDPSLEFTKELVLGMARQGADLIELGIPYSDPVADGPTIQEASQRALAAGATLEKIFGLVADLRRKTQIPLLFMTYYNPIYRFGLEKFVRLSAQAGVDGFIVPDLPVEEAGLLREISDSHGVDLIFLVAPTSTAERMAKIARVARGFIYCVSVTGVTGSRSQMAGGLEEFLGRIRRETSLPLAVGFGISGPETAAQVGALADGIIVGSSVIERIAQNLDLIPTEPEKVVQEVCRYLASLRAALDGIEK